ncbi:MAG TPA: zinc-binding dehydrogenase, partial [Candidatus Limnocylindria bacterium]|nr:zinc-binding dehydrogenase [Candidatus Limnocylindria bacterium]
AGLVDAGKITPVIDGTYPLRETPRAIAHVAAGHARGTVVIAVSQPSNAKVVSANTAKEATAALPTPA